MKNDSIRSFNLALLYLLVSFVALAQKRENKNNLSSKKEEVKINFKENSSLRTYTNVSDYFSHLRRSNNNISWFEVGPTDVGGRIRTIGIDRTNPNTLIVAGVTGGIWKTTDKGVSWQLKSDLSQNFSVTSIIQDPSSSSIWYASTGEESSYSHGVGILYKSLDNGETWANASVPQSPENYLYLTSKLAISPTTSSFFVATNGFDIARSTNNGVEFNLVLGNPNGTYNYNSNDSFIYSDVVVNQNGTLLAQISGELSEGAGFYKSIDDGITWTNITPSYFTMLPNEIDIERSIITFAPSNPDVAYAFTNSMQGANGLNENIHFHKIDVTTGAFENRSQNLTKIAFTQNDIYRLPSTQDNYDMGIAVKPDDENFAVIAGQSGTFRSSNGYTTNTGTYDDWTSVNNSQNIAGGAYNSHLDHYVVVFDPQTPNRLWCGNDGGIDVLEDATADNTLITWSSKNNGLNITQFYDISISPLNQGNKVIGSAQDNAAPVMQWNENNAVSKFTTAVTGGDGSKSFWKNNYVFGMGNGGESPSIFETSKFQGSTLPYHTFANMGSFLPDNTHYKGSNYQYAAINPNNENIIFIATGLDKLYKETNAISWNSMTQQDIKQNISTINISSLGNGLTDYGFSQLTYGNDSSDTFYFSLSSLGNPYLTIKPKLYKLVNASTSSLSNATEISSPLFPDNGEVEDIVLNREDNNEFIVVMSNPNTQSVFHTLDGGQTYQSISGNLNLSGFSPYLNCAEIITTNQGKTYLLGSTQGLFSTMKTKPYGTMKPCKK